MRETAGTNGPEGTISMKTQVLLALLGQGMRRLYENIAEINKSYLELCTLLTTVVDNLHAVSQFKHGTSTTWQYCQDSGTISKKSLKRVINWGAREAFHPRKVLA